MFKGIFAFETDYEETSSIAKRIKDFYSVPYFVKELQTHVVRDLMYLHHEISCATVLGSSCVFSQYVLANENEADNVIPALFSITDSRGLDIQTTIFLALLFDYLDVTPFAKKSAVKIISQAVPIENRSDST